LRSHAPMYTWVDGSRIVGGWPTTPSQVMAWAWIQSKRFRLPAEWLRLASREPQLADWPRGRREGRYQHCAAPLRTSTCRGGTHISRTIEGARDRAGGSNVPPSWTARGHSAFLLVAAPGRSRPQLAGSGRSWPTPRCQLPKLNVVGSIPIARSIQLATTGRVTNPVDPACVRRARDRVSVP